MSRRAIPRCLRFGVCIALAILCSVMARAASVNLGIVSYDVLIPGSTNSPGVEVFDFSNFTGAFDLPPDFPVATSLNFDSMSLMLTGPGGTQVISLGNLPPGPLANTSSVQFPSTDVFWSATLAFTLSSTDLTLYNGTTFQASSSAQTLLLPSSGASLVAGTDFAVISVASPSVASTPEPNAFALVSLGLAAVCAWRRRGPRL
jgi:PEP-CTERM motif